MTDTPPIYLVTGAAGFVGSNLVRHLVNQGVRVRAMVRKPSQAAALQDIADEVVIADLLDAESLPAAVKGVKGIYHIASLFRQEGGDESLFHEINGEGTRRLLDAAIKAGVPRFIHCSTVGVLGNIKNPPADETTPYSPGDHYQRSKITGEKIALQYFNEGRIQGHVIRPAMVYGPGDMRTLKLFRMIAKRRFFFVGDGETKHHWVDVRDLANGFHLAMGADHINAQTFILAGQRADSLKHMTKLIAKELQVPPPTLHLPVWPVVLLAHGCEIVCKPFGIEPPLYRRRVHFFVNARSFDTSKAKRELGFKPARTLEDEVADIVAQNKNLGLL